MEAANQTQSAAPPLRVPGSIGELWTMLVAFSALRDWLKLIVLGGAVETCRRALSFAWASFLSSFFLTAHFEENDTSYDWMIVWLGQHPAWQKAREVQISTRDFRNNDSSPIVLDGEEETTLAPSRKVAFLPSFGTTNVMYFHGHRMTVTRNQRYLDEGSTLESLTVRILTRSRTVLNELLLEAKRAYMEDFKHRVTVYCPNAYNDWRPVHRRPKRPLSSVILDEQVKQSVLDDAREFLASESWYSERGIPFRRGYLLHGAAGAGKTSLINSIAGELDLDIYVVTLSKRGLDDNTLNELISDIPAKAIALMEDIDAAFTHDVQRSSDASSSSSSSKGESDSSAGVTLSGLLNAIDGVAAQEGRLLFATTNHVERLDPALSRPGRMDVHVEFGLATRWQAAALFKAFYPPASGDDHLHAAEVHPPSASADADSEKRAADQADAAETDPLLLSPPATPSRAPSSLAKADGGGASSALALASPGLRPPRLPPRELDELAERFAAAVPEGEFSMATLQGHLMGFKTRPFDAVTAVPGFVERERAAVKRVAQLKADADAKAAKTKKKKEDEDGDKADDD